MSAEPRFRWSTRARYAETDAQAVVHHSAYVVWLEAARIEALRAVGHDYRTIEASGLLMPVTALEVAYRRPVRFDDVVEVGSAVSLNGRTRIDFNSTIAVDGETVATALVTVAVVDVNGRPQRLPPDLAAAISAAS